MAMYMRHDYPQIEVGKSHARPSMPHCCANIFEISVTWDIFSASADDRAEYWLIDEPLHDPSVNPPLMTALEVETAVYGVDGKAAWLILNPAPDPIV